MDSDPINQPSGRKRKWIVIFTVLAIALGVLAFIVIPLFQKPVSVRCIGFTRGNYGPQFVATNHTDKPLLINLVTEHWDGANWISDTNWPVGINLPPHGAGNCFADNNVKVPWRVHVILFSDMRDQLTLIPRLRSFFMMRRMIRLGAMGLPGVPSTNILFSPSQEFYIPGPPPPGLTQ